MKFKLRPYQNESVELLRKGIRAGSNRPVLCLPTGAGKTVTFAHLAEQAQRKGSRVAVVCHRTELISQAKETLTAYGINPLMVTYGMVQTYVRSPDKIPPMDLCIIDECHIGNFRRFVDLIPSSVQVIGVTATPIGASKKKPLRDVFTSVIAPVQINELIEKGYLARPEYHIWKIDESKLETDFKGDFSPESQNRVFSIRNLIEAIDRRVGKTLIFCSSIKQVLQVKDELFKFKDDYTIFCVHSKMSAKERDFIVQQYKQTQGSIMINCGILTAGFDDPTIETVIIYRATTSVALWLQMVGRGSRIIEGVKSKFYIFDLGGNRTRLLAWEANRDWPALFDLQGRKIKDKEAPMKKCTSCEAVIYASAKNCPYCEAAQPIKTKEELFAESIQVISHYKDLPAHMAKPYEQMTVAELIERAAYGSPTVGRPFKIGWIISQLRNRDNFPDLIKEMAAIKGYKSGWIERQLN